MKFYSDVTKKLYDTQEALTKDETAQIKAQQKKELEEKQKSEQRAARAKEVEAAYAAAVEATNRYHELRNAFVNDYKAYHMTISRQYDLADNWFTTLFNLL